MTSKNFESGPKLRFFLLDSNRIRPNSLLLTKIKGIYFLLSQIKLQNQLMTVNFNFMLMNLVYIENLKLINYKMQLNFTSLNNGIDAYNKLYS